MTTSHEQDPVFESVKSRWPVPKMVLYALSGAVTLAFAASLMLYASAGSPSTESPSEPVQQSVTPSATPSVTPSVSTTPSKAASDVQLGVITSVEGNALPYQGEVSNAENGTGDKSVGMVAPTVTATMHDGNTHVVGKGANKPHLVAIVAHWCQACNHELPTLVEYANQDSTNRVELTILSTREDKDSVNYPPSEWLTSFGWTGPALQDVEEDGRFIGLKAFGASGYPTVLAIDTDGVVKSRHVGVIPLDKLNELTTLVKQ